MKNFLTGLHGILWGAPALVLILGVGLDLTVRTGFVQLTMLGRALRLFLQRLRHPGRSKTGMTSFQALCTALAATVGTGNLVGVAGALCIGGPGSIFWMWICGILGMATKYAEVTLAVRYRVRQGREYLGGPMYMIREGLGEKWKGLALCYSFFGVLAAFGVGNAVQINAVISAVNGVVSRWGGRETEAGNLAMGLLLAGVIGAMLLGGALRIGRTAERLVPFAAGAYILLCVAALIARRQALPQALHTILLGAFSPRAATGGALGSAFLSLRVGCARGVFTNEAGMGTASIAHASAEVSHPAEQGLMGLIEVFLDTIVLCTLTALVILTAGVPIPYGVDRGAELTVSAFSRVWGDWAGTAIAIFLGIFAFATVLGWGLYGARCGQFLFGPGAYRKLALAQTAMVVLGSVLQTDTVWLLAETVNGLMAIPNLIALLLLTPELVHLTDQYRRKIGGSTAGGGNHADFHQCEPL